MGKKFITILISLVVIASLGAIIKIRFSNNKITNTDKEVYIVKGSEALKFNGISIVKDEQKVLLDTSKGELKEVNVNDGQEVKVGDVLFSYNNISISDQIDQYNRKISTNEKKILNIKTDVNKINEDINKLKTELDNIISNLNGIKDTVSNNTEDEELIREKELLENKYIQISEEKENAQNQTDILNAEVSNFEDTNAEMVTERNVLEEKVITKILAQVDGIVYINEKAINDPTEIYMNIISNDTIVRGTASEYDVSNLKVSDEVMMRIISNGEYVKGIVTKIEQRPINEDGKATTEYNFYIKPEKNIRIGFNLEIKWDYKNIEIPEEYVYKEHDEIYVVKEGINSYDHIQIKVILEDDKYYLLDGAIGVGDKLLKNTDNTLKE